ncbi:MAG TPA: polysaccharide deacetylase family protein [Gaiellales bacterium]|nr:polysaccharide deacetylase family protein [Gaiellales bacterium]
MLSSVADVAAGTAATSATASTTPPSITLTFGPTVAGELDLRRVTLAQSAGRLVLTFATTRPFLVSSFGSPGRMVCLEIGPRGDPGQWQKLCLIGATGQHAIFRIPLHPGGPRARFVAATVPRPDWTTAVVKFSQAAAGLRPGLWDIQLLSTWEGTGGCTAVVPCRDSLPHGSVVALTRIDHYSPGGCVAAGRSEAFGGPARGRHIALTFDDGPAPATPQILGILRHYHVPATFFEIGRQVAVYPTYARWVLGEGSALGDHTWSHPILTPANVRVQVGPRAPRSSPRPATRRV